MDAVIPCKNMLQWLIEYDALANENCWSALSDDPVFNNL